MASFDDDGDGWKLSNIAGHFNSFWPLLSFTTKQAAVLRRTKAAGSSGRSMRP
jgi:hypothetical protein